MNHVLAVVAGPSAKDVPAEPTPSNVMSFLSTTKTADGSGGFVLATSEFQGHQLVPGQVNGLGIFLFCWPGEKGSGLEILLLKANGTCTPW